MHKQQNQYAKSEQSQVLEIEPTATSHWPLNWSSVPVFLYIFYHWLEWPWFKTKCLSCLSNLCQGIISASSVPLIYFFVKLTFFFGFLKQISRLFFPREFSISLVVWIIVDRGDLQANFWNKLYGSEMFDSAWLINRLKFENDICNLWNRTTTVRLRY